MFKKITKQIISCGLALIMVFGMCASAYASEFFFEDVTEGSEYYTDIQRAYKLLLIESRNKATFGVKDPVTRAELANTMAILLHASLFNYEDSYPFKDVTCYDAYHSEIAWMANAKLMNGYDGYFRPCAPVTYEEFAVVLYNVMRETFGIPLSPDYPEVDVADWAKGSVVWAIRAGLMDEEDLNKQYVTKEKAAKVYVTLYKRYPHITVLNKTYTDVDETRYEYPYIQDAIDNGWIEPASSDTFLPDAGMQANAFFNMLAKFEEVDLTQYKLDEPMMMPIYNVEVEYQNAIAWAIEKDLIGEDFFAYSLLTRADMMEILYKEFGKSMEYDSTMRDLTQVPGEKRAAVDWGLSIGILKPGVYGLVNPNNMATRAEACFALSRLEMIL